MIPILMSKLFSNKFNKIEYWREKNRNIFQKVSTYKKIIWTHDIVNLFKRSQSLNVLPKILYRYVDIIHLYNCIHNYYDSSMGNIIVKINIYFVLLQLYERRSTKKPLQLCNNCPKVFQFI